MKNSRNLGIGVALLPLPHLPAQVKEVCLLHVGIVQIIEEVAFLSFT